MDQQHQPGDWTPSRRELINAALGAAVVLPVTNLWAEPAAAERRGDAPHDVVTRPVPGTDERLPVVGLGTFMTFDTLPGQPRDHIRTIIEHHWDAGGRVIDVSPLYGSSEINVGEFTKALGINNRMFLANKVWSTGEHLWDDSHAERSLQQSVERLSRERPIDVMQCHSLVNVDVIVPLMRAWKNEGRVRHVAVTHHEPVHFDALADWVERDVVDFVQVHYSVRTREAEDRIIPAAVDRGIGVLVNMPLEKARLHAIVEDQPLPDFAQELGIENWAQFFLKWVIAHPAVTCVLPATSNPDHLTENVGAMRGPLPDPDTRLRMVRHMESVPGFDRIPEMPWYPNKNYVGVVSQAQAALLARGRGR